jgi:hypothetical protein
MRLVVTYHSNVPGANKVWYSLTPSTQISEQEKRRLAERINLMGKEVLGDDFHSVDTEYVEGEIAICVTMGLSSGSKKFDLRSFLGWVKIFAMETGLATRASMPPIR